MLQGSQAEAKDDEVQPGSSLIEDKRLNVLFKWVKENGGKFHCEPREDKLTKVRGLYASCDISEITVPVAQIPSKLIISPYHIARQPFSQW